MSDMSIDKLRVNELQIGDSAILSATKGTEGFFDRLSIKFKRSAQIEIEPGEDFSERSTITSQILLFGRLRNSGGVKWRSRLGLSIFADSDNGEAVYIDSTLTSDAPVTATAIPMVFRIQSNTNDQPEFDIVFHPSDSTVEIKDYKRSIFRRQTLDQWLKT